MQDCRKERIDVLLFKKGLAESRERAKQLVKAGLVYVNGQKVDKPGTTIWSDKEIELKGVVNPYISRGGLKLEKALRQFSIQAKDLVWMDIGASTGGFTHCLLQHGAKKVYSIDVGCGQLAEQLRKDPRVVAMEGTDIRNLQRNHLIELPRGAVIDVSFISIVLILPVVKKLLDYDSHIICLVKPQFEVGKGRVGNKGVVRDAILHQEALQKVLECAVALNLQIRNLSFSPITGREGNIEFLAYLYYGDKTSAEVNIPALSRTVVRQAHDFFTGR